MIIHQASPFGISKPPSSKLSSFQIVVLVLIRYHSSVYGIYENCGPRGRNPLAALSGSVARVEGGK